MSIIAWDGKIIAADKQASRNGQVRATTKLYKVFKANGNGDDEAFIVGFTGTEQTGIIMMRWFEAGANEDSFPKSQMNGEKEGDFWSEFIAVNPKGLEYYSLWYIPLVVNEKRFAIGSGDEYAMGAMAMGADAIRAVKMASEICESCGLGIDAYDTETMEQII